MPILTALFATTLSLVSPQDCEKFYLAPEAVPSVSVPAIEVPVGVWFTFAVSSSPIVAARVAPPLRPERNPDAKEFQCGTDYLVELDDKGLRIKALTEVPLYVEADLYNGITLAGYVLGGCKLLGAPVSALQAPLRPWEPPGDLVLMGPGVKDILPMSYQGIAKAPGDLLDAVQFICDAYLAKGSRIDLILFGHGGPGNFIAFPGGDGTELIDVACEVGSKVNSWTFVACLIGAGAGPDFLCDIQEKSIQSCGCMGWSPGLAAPTGIVTTSPRGSYKDDQPLLFKLPDGTLEAVAGKGSGAKPARKRLLLPLDLGTFVNPVDALLRAYGTNDSRWDLDRNGVVRAEDLALLQLAL